MNEYNIQNRINRIEARKSRVEKEKRINFTKEALGYIALSAVILGSISMGLSNLNPEVTYSTETTLYEVQPSDGINNAVFEVDRNPNEIPYQVVADHIKSMPENQDVLSDGLQPGERLVIPKSVDLKD